MSIKLKDTILDYIDKAYKDSSGNVISSTYLPLSGGTITFTGLCGLTLKRTTRNSNYIHFTGGDADFGYLGFANVGNPVYADCDGYSYTLIHSGNIGSQSVDNANKLSGYDSSVYVKSFLDSTDDYLSFRSRAVFKTSYISGQGDFGTLIIPTWTGNKTDNYYLSELRFEAGQSPKFRCSHNGVVELGWKTIAFTDSNVASATKLQTARTIWGQSFNGTGNVSGNLHLNTSNIYWHYDATNYCISSVAQENSSPYLKIAHYGGVAIETSGTERVRILYNGSVGIGTTSPSYKLDVNGSSNATTLYQNGKTLDNYYLPLSGGAITNNLTVSKSASKDSTITPTTCILNIGTRASGHSGYHTGIGFNALYYGTYSQHIHAWIGLGTYTTTATAECYPLVFATNESTTTNTAPIERMKIAPDGAVSINKSLTVGGYAVITSGNIGSQSVNYASSAGSVAWGNVSGKPSTFTPSSHTHDYLPLSGGSLTGPLTLLGSQYTGNFALNLSNSDIIDVNAIYTSDNAEGGNEGIQFKRSNGNYDSIWASAGVLYFSPNGNNSSRTGSYSTNNTVLHSGNWSSYCASSSHNHNSTYAYVGGSNASGTWGINITGSAGSISKVSGGFTISSAGWYKLARYASTDPRGSVRLALVTTGGNYTPRYTEVKFSEGWSDIIINQNGKFDWISDYRYTKDESNCYIEAYFKSACTFTIYKLSGESYVDDRSVNWTLYTSATAGSGSVIASSVASPSSSLYSNKLIASGGGFHSIGYDNNYILLAGSGHKAISDFATASHTHSYLPLSGGTVTGNISLGSYGILGFGSSIPSGYVDSAAPSPDGTAVWLATTGGGGEAAGIMLDGDTVKIWSPMDNPPVLIDSDGQNLSYPILHSGNWSTYCAAASHTHSQYLTSVTKTAVTNALGYTPYDSANPSGYITRHVSTNTNANPFVISRLGSGSESVKIGVNDSQCIFCYENDELSNSFVFEMRNTGTEGGNTSSANTSTVTFSGSSSGSVVYATTFSGNLSGNASSASSVAWSNVSGKPSTFTPSSHTHSYLPLSGGEMTGSISHTLEPSGGRIIYGKTRNSGIKYDYNGNECLMISTGTYANASIAMYTCNRLSLNDSNGQWDVSSPDMHIKNGCVAINKLIANGTNLSYNLDINGSFNATTGYIGGYTIIHSGNIGSQSVNYASSAGSASSINGLSFSAVTSLPSSPNSGTVYFVTG